METVRIDGKATAAAIKGEIREQVDRLVADGERAPKLTAVLVGHDGGSETYVANKIKACAECGFESDTLRFEDNITEAELLDVIARLNSDETVDGFIVQLPLPARIDEQKIIEAIDPAKDVDGFHPLNVGRLATGLPGFASATPAGIMELLKRYGIETRGKHAVVVGRSNIVGKPMSRMLLEKTTPGNCTVTVCHSATKDLGEICRQADILVAATGKPGMITADMVKPGAVIIDVGTTRVEDPTAARGWRLKGDVDFAKVAPIASAITPVPGGVGPMTICMLLLNTLKARTDNPYKTKAKHRSTPAIPTALKID